ncbi:MAG: low molecular weight phosphotyrosine protein phosphatase [Burkholderiales bacterium]|nr:low molecular weight phosphotyrosine protein phosphatase [Burkholderiales bacterium]
MNVLFVCLGNICRSPTAEGVFRKLVLESGLSGELGVDSAGTNGFHIGQAPDPRSIAHAAQRSIDLTTLRGRQVVPADFERFDYVIAMDNDNLRQLKALCPQQFSGKISLLLAYGDNTQYREVPDPYHGEAADFEVVLDLIVSGCRGLMSHIAAHRQTPANTNLMQQQ